MNVFCPEAKKSSSGRDGNAIDLVVMALQKRLSLVNQVPHNYSTAQGKDQVLVIWVQD